MQAQEIARKPYSAHPDDHYLAVVLRYVPESVEPYVTHLENSSRGNPFYVEGHYFKDKAAALHDFKRRGK